MTAVRHGLVRHGTARRRRRPPRLCGSRRDRLILLLAGTCPQFLNDAAMLPRLTALLALALGLLRIAALSLHPDKLIADAPFSLADEVHPWLRFSFSAEEELRE